MVDAVRFAGILLPILLGCVWTVVAAREGKRKLFHAGLSGAIGGALICTAGIMVTLPADTTVTWPLFIPLAFCAVFGAIAGTITALLIGLPAGLMCLAIGRRWPKPKTSNAHVKWEAIATKLRLSIGPVAASIMLTVAFVSCSVMLLLVLPDQWLPLPQLTEVATIRVERGPQGEFSIPPDCWNDLYASLRPCNDAWQVSKWCEIQRLSIECMSGRKYEVDVYRTDGPPGAFCVTTNEGRSYFRGGDTERLTEIIDRAYSNLRKEKR